MPTVSFLNCSKASLLIKGVSYYQGQYSQDLAEAASNAVKMDEAALLYAIGLDESEFWTAFQARETAAGITPAASFNCSEETCANSEELKAGYDALRTRIDTLRAAEGMPTFVWETHPTLGAGAVYSRPWASARYPTDLRLAMQTWERELYSIQGTTGINYGTFNEEWWDHDPGYPATCEAAQAWVNSKVDVTSNGFQKETFDYAFFDYSGPPYYDPHQKIKMRYGYTESAYWGSSTALDIGLPNTTDPITLFFRCDVASSDYGDPIEVDIVDLSDHMPSGSGALPWSGYTSLQKHQAILSSTAYGSVSVTGTGGTYGLTADWNFSTISGHTFLYFGIRKHNSMTVPSIDVCTLINPYASHPTDYNSILSEQITEQAYPNDNWGSLCQNIDRWDKSIFSLTFEP